MNVQNLVTTSLVKEWLKKEEENIKPYLRAWKGTNPYDSMSQMKFNLWAMVVVIVATMVWSVFGPEQAKILGYICAISFFSLGQAGWRSARKELNRFISTVVWCEKHNVPEHLLGRSSWTKEDIGEILGFFVPTIKERILPLENEYKKAHPFPKKTKKARMEHDECKTQLVETILMITPMFGNFNGVVQPVNEALRLAQEHNS
jgi:hypothetical protein